MGRVSKASVRRRTRDLRKILVQLDKDLNDGEAGLARALDGSARVFELARSLEYNVRALARKELR